MTTVEKESVVAGDPNAVWERALTPDGINDELRPFLRMTTPRGADGLALIDVEAGTHVGRSWILLLGLLPIDADDITVAEVGPGRRFLERSRMLTMDPWEHERTVEPADGGGSVVTDRLTFEPRGVLARMPGSDRALTRLVTFLFDHRHERLARHWGQPAT